MLGNIRRCLFFSVPKLAGLSAEEADAKLKEAMQSFTNLYDKESQQKIRDQKFSPEQSEKLELILDQMLKLNTYEIMSLRKAVMDQTEAEFNWPVFRRPNENVFKFAPGTELSEIGEVSSPAVLVQKILDKKTTKKEVAKDEGKADAKETVVEKSTFNLVLVGFDPASKVKFIKCVKDVLGLGLKESKDKVEEVAKGPVILFKSVSKESHGKVHEQLIAAGGQVEFQ
jgi:ribosomal protein L7/L12